MRRRRPCRRARSGISAGMSPMRRQTVRSFRERPDVMMRPLYTSDEGGSVLISSDTWPGEAGALGRTKARDRRGARQEHPADPQGRVRLYVGRPRGRAVRDRRRLSGRALQPRAYVARAAVLRAALVQEAPERAGARRLSRHRADRGELQGAARRGPHLAGAEPRGHVPHAARRGRIRRCRADLVRQPGQRSRWCRAAARCRTISACRSPISMPGSTS